MIIIEKPLIVVYSKGKRSYLYQSPWQQGKTDGNGVVLLAKKDSSGELLSFIFDFIYLIVLQIHRVLLELVGLL